MGAFEGCEALMKPSRLAADTLLFYHASNFKLTVCPVCGPFSVYALYLWGLYYYFILFTILAVFGASVLCIYIFKAIIA